MNLSTEGERGGKYEDSAKSFLSYRLYVISFKSGRVNSNVIALSRLFSTQVVCHSRESGNPSKQVKEYESGKLYDSIKSIS